MIRFLIFLSLSFFSTNFFAQTTDTEGMKWGGYLQLGVRPTNVNAMSVDFRYVDESPSRDNISTNFDIEGGTRSGALRFGLELETPKKWFFQAGMEFIVSQYGGYAFQSGVGKTLKKTFGKATLRPFLGLEYGSGDIVLGNIKNNDTYIQVNNTKFYSETVEVRLNSNYVAVRPQIQFNVPIDGDLHFRLDVGYKIASSVRTSKLHFSGNDEQGEPTSAEESINAPNVFLKINGRTVTQPFMNQTGIWGQVGIFYQF